MEVNGQLHAPAALLPGKEPLVAIGWVPIHKPIYIRRYFATTQQYRFNAYSDHLEAPRR